MAFIKQLHKLHIAAITFFVFTAIVFLVTDLSTDSLVGDIFGSIYDYADEESRAQAHDFISEVCSSNVGSSGPMDFAFSDFCSDPQKIAKLKEECSQLKDIEAEIAPSLKNCMKVPEGEMKFCDEVMDKYQRIREIEEPCGLVESGELELLCKERQVDIYLENSNTDKLYTACKEVENGSNPREELGKMVQVVMPDLDDTELNPLQSVAVKINEMRETVVAVSAVLAIILIVILFVAYMPYFMEFAYSFSKIMIRVGILLALPPLLLAIYTYFVPIDTSWILMSLQNGLPQDALALAAKELMPLALQAMIPLTLFYIGIILISFGTFGWFLFKNLKKVDLDSSS